MTVSTAQYEFTWGKKPRGTGFWWFFSNDEKWSYSFHGRFTEAKKAAVAMATAAGISNIKVGT